MNATTVTLCLPYPVELPDGQPIHIELDAVLTGGVLHARDVSVRPESDDPLERMVALAKRVNPGPLSELTDEELKAEQAAELEARHQG